MTSATVSDSLALAVRLVEIWRATPPTEFRVLETDDLFRPVSVLAHVDHAAKLMDAIDVLAGREMLVQCVPLIRSVMEAAVTAVWFAVTTGSSKAAMLDGAEHRKKLIRDLERISGGGNSLEAKDPEGGKELSAALSSEASNFANRVSSLEGMDWVYSGYRLLSGYTHAGASLMEHYLSAADKSVSQFDFTYSPDYEFEHAEACFWLLPVMVHLALSAWDAVDNTHPHRAQLEEIAAESGITSVVARRVTNSQRAAERLAERTARGAAKRARAEGAS